VFCKTNAPQYYRNSFVNGAKKKRDDQGSDKKSWLGITPSQLLSPFTNACALVAVIIMMTMVTMSPVVRRPVVVVGSVIWIPTVIAVWIIAIVPRIPVIAIPVGRITEPDSDSADAD
jgi:hypothetical protein